MTGDTGCDFGSDGLLKCQSFRSAYRRLMLMLVSMVLAGVCMLVSFGTDVREVDFSAVTLNLGTSSFFAHDLAGVPVQSDCSSAESADAVLGGVIRRNQPRRVLWLGNSQLHAINQFKEGQRNALPLVREKLEGTGTDVVTLSPPNGSPIEHYLLLEYVLSQTKIEKLLVAVCFDDLRDVEIRPSLRSLVARTEVKRRLEMSKEGAFLVQKYVGDAHNNTVPTSTRKGLVTWQERVESLLNDKLSAHSSLWATREKMRGILSLKAFVLRNKIFGITAQTKRPVLPARYAENMDALSALCEVTRREKVELYLYVPPIRHDVDLPYVLAEYEEFKRQLESLARSNHGTVYRNLETLIPADLWGGKESTRGGGALEIDFMHFQSSGHVLLADQVFRWLVNRDQTVQDCER